MSVTETPEEYLSAECAVAKEPGYSQLHGKCRQTKDVPLIHARGVLLIRRCPCKCHGRRAT